MPGQERIDSLYDLPAIRQEQEQLLAMLKELGVAISQPVKADGIRAATESFSKSKEFVKELQDQIDKLNEKLKKFEDQNKKTGDAVEAAQKRYANSQSDSAKEVANLNVKTQEQTKANKEAAREVLGLNDAYKKLVQQYDQAQRSAKNLAAEQGENSDAFIKAAADAKKLSDRLKEIDNAVGQNQRNVGNYKESFSILEKELTSVTAKINALKQTARDPNSGPNVAARGGDPGQVRAQQEELKKLTVQEQTLTQVVSRQSQGFTSLTLELRQNERALQGMRGAGLQGTEAFKQLEHETTEAKKSFNEFSRSQKILESGAPAITGLTIAAKGLAGAYAVGAGAAALFGDEEGKIDKEVQKLVAIMTVLQGLNEAHELIMQKNAIATALAGAAQKAYAFVVGESVGALKLFRIALAATGIGLFILAIVELVKYFSESSEAAMKAAEQQKAYTEVVSKAAEEVGKATTEVNTMAEKIKLAKEGFLDKTKVLKEYNESIGKTIGQTDDLNKAEQLLIDKGPEFIKLTFLKAQAQAAAEAAAEQAKESIKAQAKAATEFVSIGDKVKTSLKGFTLNPLKLLDINSAKKTLTDLNAEALKVGEEQKKKEIDTAENKFDIFSNLQKKFLDEAAKYAKDHGLNFFGDTGEEEKKAEDFAKDLAKLQQDIRKAAYEAIQARKQDELTAITEVVDDEKQSFNQRLLATQAYYDKRKDIAETQLAFDLSTQKFATEEEKRAVKEKLNDKDLGPKQRAQLQQELVLIDQKGLAERQTIEAKYNNQIVAINADSEKQITDLVTKNLDDRAKARLADYQKRRAAAQETFDIADSGINTQKALDLTSLDQQYRAGKMKREDYQKALIEVDSKYSQKSLDNQIAYYSELLDSFKLTDKEKADVIEKIADLEQKKSAETTKKVLDDEQKKLDAKKQVSELEKQLAQEVFSFLVAIEDAKYTRQLNGVQDEQDLNSQKYERQVEFINNSTLAEEAKADKLKILEAEKAAQDEKFNRRKKQIQQEQARFDKVAGIASIIISTIQAVAKALAVGPPQGFVLAAITAALGAVQLAKAIATPIPKFEKGTLNAPGGLAKVSEKGAELVIEPSGKKYLTPSTEAIMNIPKGSKIIPNDEINQMMYSQMMRNTVANLREKPDTAVKDAIMWQTAELKKAYGNSKRPINISVNDFKGSDYIKKAVKE